MPAGDWQFWVVTALAVGAVYLLVRPFLPRRGSESRSRRKVKLTIDGKPTKR